MSKVLEMSRRTLAWLVGAVVGFAIWLVVLAPIVTNTDLQAFLSAVFIAAGALIGERVAKGRWAGEG
jgi:hypothetical protein